MGFYEDDEPVDRIVAAFESDEKGFTGPDDEDDDPDLTRVHLVPVDESDDRW